MGPLVRLLVGDFQLTVFVVTGNRHMNVIKNLEVCDSRAIFDANHYQDAVE